MVIQTWVFGRCFFKNEKPACHFEEDNLQYLLSMIRFELSSENYEFGKFVCTTVNLTASQYLNFPDDIGNTINEYDF